jgi:hypothetical protein
MKRIINGFEVDWKTVLSLVGAFVPTKKFAAVVRRR